MLSSPAMRLSRPLVVAILLAAGLAGCKPHEPQADPLKTQRETMERAKDVGKTMQKSVDQESRKADEEGK